MKQFHYLHALVPVLILVTSRGISAVGRAGPARGSSLGSEAPTNVAYQGSSPAELEEQEEEDGNQEQGNDPEAPQSPVEMSTQIPVEVTAPAAGVSGQNPTFAYRDEMESSFAQNPTGQNLAWTDAGSQGSKASSLQQAAPQQAVPQPGLRVESSSRQFLSYAEPNGQPQENLPEQSAHASPVALGLSALSSTASSMPSRVQPEKASTSPFPITVPGISHSDAAVPLRSAVLPQSMAEAPLPEYQGGSFASAPSKSFPVTKDTSTCHPPCIQGRGICNDNLCFCKTPYTGTTCQHKLSSYSRIKYPMLVAASLVLTVFGILFAQILHGFVTSRIEKRLVWLGDGMVKQEIWMPPDNAKGKKKGGS